LAPLFGHDLAGAREHIGLRRAQTAVPHPKRIYGHTEQRRKLLLGEGDLTAERAQFVHSHTMPSVY